MNLLTCSEQPVFAGNTIKRFTRLLTPQIVKAMKLTFVLLTAAFLQVSANGLSQNVSLTLKDAPVEKLFKEIERQTGLGFLYTKKMLQETPRVNISVKDAPVADVLKKYFIGQNLDFSIQNNTIVITKKPVTNTVTDNSVTAAPLPVNVSGRITDEEGKPLEGASVKVKGTAKGASTNANGEFSLTDVGENATLVVSYVGFEEKSIVVGGRENLSVALKISTDLLDAPVIIGYGSSSKRKNTGSVGSITSKDIAKQPIGNPLASLPGRISGTLVAQNNGLPGSAVQIQIRGQNTLSSGAIPLYVIDGVPFTNFNGGSPATDNLNAFGTSGANGGISPFGMINPGDIERIDILKDADATAIYGSRGANGVILITTKKGKTGKTKLDISVNRGMTEVSRFIPMLDLKQYLQLRREAFANDGVVPNTTNAPDLTVWDTTKSTDWQKLLLGGTGNVTDVQATLSGGEGRTRFLFNAAYRKETTVFPGDNSAKRFSTRLNIDHTSDDRKFNASISASYSHDKTDILTTDLASVYNLPPTLPLYDASGKLFWSSAFTNPLASLLKRYNGITTNLIGNANFRYTILRGLNLKANFGYTINNLDQNTTNPASSQNPVNNPTSSAVFSDNKAENYIIEPTAEYAVNISNGKLTALAGASWQENTSKGVFLNGAGYTNEALLGTLSAAGTVTVAYNNIVKYKYAAAFGRLNYNWKEKYILNATFRRDGSSRFGPNNRFGNFGAVGATWIFTQENFFQDKLGFLSFGKLRASYGSTGNDQISNYLYLPLYTSTTVYLGSPAIYPQTLPNADIQWETTRKLEIAMDLGFLKDRILFTANYYRNRSSNLITFIRVPVQSGYNSQTANLPALVQNSGLELELNTTNVNSKDFKWTTGLNITVPKNKLISFPGLANTFSSTSYIVGQPINFSRIYNFTGINPTTGVATYEDVDKDGAVTFANDRVVAPIGTPYYGGLSNTFTYKNWEFDFFFQFNHRNGVTNVFTTPVGTMRNQNTSVLDRWKKSGDITTIPGASTTAGSPIATSYGNYTSSSATWGNASYVKLRSVNLSYTLPEKWISRIKMSNCRLYVQGQNVFTKAKNKYIFDTETTVQGGPSGLGTGTIGQVMPPLRTIVFGINCSF